jgi:hypothetical protein
MSWCRVSSLTAAVVKSLKGASFPATKQEVLSAAGKDAVDGWDISYFLKISLSRARYDSVRSVISDLEGWLEVQG